MTEKNGSDIIIFINGRIETKCQFCESLFLAHNTSSQELNANIIASIKYILCNALVCILLRLLTIASIYGQIVTNVIPGFHTRESFAICHDWYVAHLRTFASCLMEIHHQWK